MALAWAGDTEIVCVGAGRRVGTSVISGTAGLVEVTWDDEAVAKVVVGICDVEERLVTEEAGCFVSVAVEVKTPVEDTTDEVRVPVLDKEVPLVAVWLSIGTPVLVRVKVSILDVAV